MTPVPFALWWFRGSQNEIANGADGVITPMQPSNGSTTRFCGELLTFSFRVALHPQKIKSMGPAYTWLACCVGQSISWLLAISEINGRLEVVSTIRI
ncbi:MAG TPA: hypothetical protein DD706_17335 [Nitrospiraceae bacterium]|nr:hypothetical protein [Nitrospiraceae bacterium]